MAEALASPQTEVNGTVVDVAGDRFIGTPLTMADTAFRVRRASPELGEHSDEILRELGYPADVVDELRRARVVA
jgi:crotonobetainyl-CoA:carnitine CoA-transferase CaiB-like acyl-CoA transferase